MRASLDEHQISYLKNVLGIGRVLLPKSEGRGPSQLRPSRLIALLPLNGDEFPLRGEDQALLEKMFRAMKLESGDILIVSWRADAQELPEEIAQIQSLSEPRPVVVFGREGADRLLGAKTTIGTWHPWGETKFLATYTPRELVSNPELKKPAWQHLQLVMKELE